MSCGKCRRVVSDSHVKVEEGARKAVFLNASRDNYFTTRIDGCMVENKVAADFVVSKINVGDLIVELKGTDVTHGAEQVLATAEGVGNCTQQRGPMAGLIVCRQYPRVDTKIQRLRNTFAKKFKGPIHVVTKNTEFDFERVLSFQGPF